MPDQSHITSPLAVAVFGLPGSGKSYFASRLAARMKAEYLSSDELRKILFPNPTYSPEEKANLYDHLLRRMQRAYRDDRSVVVDATFYKAALRNRFAGAIVELGGHLQFIEVQADEETTRERVSKPREDSDADYAVYLKLKGQFEPLDQDHLVLRSDQGEPILETVERAVRHLQQSQQA